MSFRTHPSNVLNRDNLQNCLKANLPLIGILAGFVLVAVATGQFSNPDSNDMEYQTALGVLKWGMPYVTYGNLLNQPPIGFYVEAAFFKVFGSSYETGLALTTLFGAGCIFLLYKIAKIFYGRRTGLLAAAIFALTPWQVAFSRLFVIDGQCLFFSLLYLFAGILAIQRNSRKLLFVSGFFFAVAITTKLFGVFMLIPLALYYFYHKPRAPSMKWVVPAMVVPALVFSYLWYEVFTDRSFVFIFAHDDFSNFYRGAPPSYFFVGNFLLSTLGTFFSVAVVLSLVLSVSRRKMFAKFLGFEMICVVTILAVAGVHTALGAGMNLAAPYVGSVKYDYQLVPLFSLLAASVAYKFYAFRKESISQPKKSRLLMWIAVAALVLLVASVAVNLEVLNNYATQKVVQFYVERDVNYSFTNVVPFAAPTYATAVQLLGFAFIAFSFLWASKDVLGELVKRSPMNEQLPENSGSRNA
jgi:4-amino-4-deoxy-L-arabinose transferase-like glycosyltransferase